VKRFNAENAENAEIIAREIREWTRKKRSSNAFALIGVIRGPILFRVDSRMSRAINSGFSALNLLFYSRPFAYFAGNNLRVLRVLCVMISPLALDFLHLVTN
jgi:hypothetical protein